MQQLNGTDPDVRAVAAWRLAHARRVGSEGAAALVQALGDEARSVSEAATWALGLLSLQDPDVRAATKRLSTVGPKTLHVARPEYPADALRMRIDGEVMVDFLIGEDGRVMYAEVRRHVRGLDEAAVRSIKQWTFQPATRDGRPVAFFAQAPVEFRMESFGR